MLKVACTTGNEHKIRELEAIFAGKLDLLKRPLDIEEVQGEGDVEVILRHKLREAYARVQAPVIAEDVSVELKSLAGMPGPFIKYFSAALGHDALYKISLNTEADRVKAICAMGYKDQEYEIIVLGVVEGRLCPPSGEGFGV